MHPLDLVKTRFQLQSAAQVVGVAPGVNVQASLNPHHHSELIRIEEFVREANKIGKHQVLRENKLICFAELPGSV